MEENRLPEVYPEFVSWPPSGYLIDDLAYARWSFHLVGLAQHVDTKNTRIRMRRKDTGAPQPLRILDRAAKNWYLGGLVWVPEQLQKPEKGEPDITYEVEIDHISYRGTTRSYRYEVRLIDAETVLGRSRS